MFSQGFDIICEIKEKNALRRAANCIGAAYAFIFVFSFLLQIAMTVAIVILGEKATKFISVYEDPVMSALLQAVLSVIMFIPMFLIVTKLARRTVSSVIEIKKPKKESFWYLVLIGVGACQIGEVLATLFHSVLAEIGLAPNMPQMEYGTSVSGVLMAFLSIAVVPALVEEFAVRGVIMGLLKPFGQGFSIIVSAVVFGLMHGNLVQIPFAFFAGLALGFITVKSGSIWPAVVVHFINNAISVAAGYLQMLTGAGVSNTVYSVLGILLLLAGAFGTAALSQKEKTLFSLESSDRKLSEKQKFSTFFSAPIVIIGLVMTAIEIIFVQVAY